VKNNIYGSLKEEDVVGKIIVEEEDDSPHKLNNVPFVIKLIILLINATSNMVIPLSIRNNIYLLVILIKEMNNCAIFLYKIIRKILEMTMI